MSPDEPSSGSRLPAILALLLVAVLWSFGGLLIKHIDWPSPAIAGGRSAIAALLLLLFVRRPRLPASGPELGAAVAYAITVMAFVAATKLTTAANAILLQYTAPVYVALFGAWYLRERVTLRDWLAVAAVLCGMALFFLDELDLQGLRGNLLAVLSGVAFAWMVLFFRRLKDQSSLNHLLLGNLLAFLCGIPFMRSAPQADDLLLLGVLGVAQLGAPYIIYAWAIRRVRALDAILITMLEPLLNPLWVGIFHGEQPSRNALVGGAIVVGAVALRGAFSAREGAATAVSLEKQARMDPQGVG